MVDMEQNDGFLFQNMHTYKGRAIMKTKLDRIRDQSEHDPSTVFTFNANLINKEMIFLCHQELKANKANGIGATKAYFEEHLEYHMQNLLERLKRKMYPPKRVQRVCIPKTDGTSKRPLGLVSYED